MFTDTHSHIHFRKEFPDLPKILERSVAAGVTRQIIVGCTPKDSYEALEFVKQNSGVQMWSNSGVQMWSTLGVHPHNANLMNDEVLAKFKSLAQKEKIIVALGEMGLDYFRNFQPRNVQKKALLDQLKLARELDLPAVVHVRDAWEDALQILDEEKNKKVILHCFTGTLEFAQRCWKNGFYTSFSGVLTYPKNNYLREIAAAAPVDRILIETDCPYLTPQPLRGKRNEPAFVVETAKELARVRGLAVEEIGRLTTRNALEIFGPV